MAVANTRGRRRLPVEAGIETKLGEHVALVRSLLGEQEQLQGTLISRYVRCGKPGCACAKEPSHGPYVVLSNRSGGFGQFQYLRGGEVAVARELVSRHRRFRKGLRRLRGVNVRLQGLLARYAAEATRRGARTLKAASALRGN
jgi:hypothetical protein